MSEKVWPKKRFMEDQEIKEDTFRAWTLGDTRSGAKLAVCRVSFKHTFIREKDWLKFLEDCGNMWGTTL